MIPTSRPPAACAVLLVFLIVVACTEERKDPSLSEVPTHIKIAGVELEPPPAQFRRYCKLASVQLKRSVPCPDLFPAISDAPAPDAELCFGNDGKLASPPCLKRDVFLMQRIFGGDDSYLGQGPGRGSGHLTIWSVPTSALRREGFGCKWFGRMVGSVALGEVEGRFFSCPDVHDVSGRFPIDSGHLVLQLTEGSYTIGVSLHGHSKANRKLAVTIVKSLKQTAP